MNCSKSIRLFKMNGLSTYPKSDQRNFSGSAFHTDRTDVFFEKDVVLKHVEK